MMMKMMKLEKRKSAILRKTRKKKISVYIPEDVLVKILLRLPARSLGKYRCVSKSWLSITSNTAFVHANAQHNHRSHSSSVIQDDLARPITICLDSGVGLCEYQQPFKSIPKHSVALASCDGLVCALRWNSTNFCYYVINPLTGQSITLPIDDNDYLTSSMGFYFHPSTSTYRLIRLNDVTCHVRVNEVLVIGESSWRLIPGNIPAFRHCEYPLDLNENIYWLAFSQETNRNPDTVVIFDEEQEVYSVISLPPALAQVGDFGRKLFDFNGEVGLSVLGKVEKAIDVWIMEESFWIKRYSVNYDINICPSQLTPWWCLRRAISIGDEELLINLNTVCHCISPSFCIPSPRGQQVSHYLVRCNLKSGACVVQKMTRSLLNNSIHSYTETLTNPQCSNIHITL